MWFWPIIISLVVLAIAYLIFYMLPAVFDFGSWFLIIIGGFLALYIGAVVYLHYAIPEWDAYAANAPTGQTSIEVEDVIVK